MRLAQLRTLQARNAACSLSDGLRRCCLALAAPHGGQDTHKGKPEERPADKDGSGQRADDEHTRHPHEDDALDDARRLLMAVPVLVVVMGVGSSIVMACCRAPLRVVVVAVRCCTSCPRLGRFRVGPRCCCICCRR